MELDDDDQPVNIERGFTIEIIVGVARPFYPWGFSMDPIVANNGDQIGTMVHISSFTDELKEAYRSPKIDDRMERAKACAENMFTFAHVQIIPIKISHYEFTVVERG
jgi:hypothetical protein